MKSYILIPHFENWTLTHQRLWELYRYCRDNITEVIVIDDCSMDDETEGGLRWWAQFRVQHDFKVSSIRTPENLNFLRASNFGIRHLLEKVTSDDIIILLSNDVEIRNDFVRQIADKIGQSPKSLVGGVLYSHDTGWNKFGNTVFPYIEGWLLAMNMEGWTLAEWGFDERFSPSDYEDVDLSTFMRTMRYELIPLNNPGLHHIGGQSIKYGPERLARTNENRKKFEEKWVTDSIN